MKKCLRKDVGWQGLEDIIFFFPTKATPTWWKLVHLDGEIVMHFTKKYVETAS